MNLYLIRHADALPVGEARVSEDAERPLSPAGVEQARKLGRALQRNGVTFDLILTSPLLRARQTAEEMLAGANTPNLKVLACTELEPGVKPKRLARFVRDQAAEGVALVGHQPDLSHHAAWLVGSKKAQIDFAKAGVAYIVCDRARKGEGTLVWLLTPEWLG